MADVDDVLGAHRPVTRSVRVIVDGGILAELDRLEAALESAVDTDRRLNRKAEAPAIAEQIRVLHQQGNDSAVTFTFQSVGRKLWSDLQASHPPTQDQIDESSSRDEQPPDWNPETFPAAAIAASCVDPDGMTVVKAQRIVDDWSMAQVNQVWQGCLSANIGAADIPFTSPAFDVLRRFGGSWTTADPEESPGPSL